MQLLKAPISGDILKSKASEIFRSLEALQSEVEPKWSEGWLSGFKKRYNIKEYVYHGEGATADIDDPDKVRQMEEVRTICSQYLPKDRFNCDETGLWWKLTPDRTLATESSNGGKKSKDRVTIAFTCNADGSEKITPWLIGKFENPRCFKNINKRLMGVKYRFNSTKWMTGDLFQEFLNWFNDEIKRRDPNRKVDLLLDNFSGHELAIQRIGGLNGLSNVRIVWLPSNTTSHWQPLDQGIIANFKLYYRKKWVRFMIHELDHNRIPNKTVTLFHAVKWTVEAWQEVKPRTIEKCWIKSTCSPKQENEDALWDFFDREALYELSQSLLRIPNLLNPLDPEEFVNPSSEAIQEDEEEILQEIIERINPPKEVESETEEPARRVLYHEVIAALNTLKLYEMQQADGSQDTIEQLEALQRRVGIRRSTQGNQTLIHGYFGVLQEIEV
jgi:hypothetical protein